MSAPPPREHGHSALAKQGARCKLSAHPARPRSHPGTWGADLYVPAGQGASEAAELALATPAAGAAAGALARLPPPAALKFLRQMRPGVAQAALAALQACALPHVWMHSHKIYRGLNAMNPYP